VEWSAPIRRLGPADLKVWVEWSAPIRRLGPADLKACLALAVDREWPAEEHKWTLLLEAAEAYGVDDPSGGLAGAVVLGRYGANH
jgi:hypothetical protein